MAQSGEGLAARLHNWAVHEMGYRPSGRYTDAEIPTPDDFRRICRGPMVEIWNYVLNNVHSARTVRTVKGNLALKSRRGPLSASTIKTKQKGGDTQSQDKAELLERKRVLKAELTSTSTAIGHIEQDMDRLQTYINNTEHQYQRVCTVDSDTRKKAALLKIHSRQITEEVERYDEYTRRMRTKVEVLSNTGNDIQYYTKEGDGSDSLKLETACTKGVREACDNIATFLGGLLKGEFGDNKETVQRHREKLWQDIEAVIGQFIANQIVQSLCLITLDSTDRLRDFTTKIDIRKDAENLKFKYEQGQLVDMSNPPSTLCSVRQLLEESQARHFQRFIASEKSKNQAYKLGQRLSEVTEMVHEHLHRHMGEDQGDLDLAKKIYQTELETASCRATLRTAENEADVLREQINKAAREKQILYSKYQSIQDFNKIAESKQNLIRVLARQNVNSRDKLDSQQFEIQRYIQNSLSHHDADTRCLTSQLKNGVATETERVAKIPLPYLMFTLIDSAYKVAVMDLSINRLYNVEDTPQTKALQTVMNNQQFPSFKAPEKLLPWVLALQREVTEIEMALQQHDVIINMLEGRNSTQQTSLQKVPILCKKVKENDDEQLNRVLPVIQKRLSHATQALTECLNLKDTVQVWWEQPGQNSVPWVQLDDMTIREWKDRYRVAITRYRQLKMQ